VNVGDRFAWLRAVMAAQPRPTLAEAAVAVVLAECFNADKGAAWPASRTIAAALRMDRANIRRALRSLENRGLIVRAEGRFRSAAFALAIPQQEGVLQPPQRGSNSPLKGGSTTPAKGVLQPPEQVVFRSEAVGIRNPAASARFADAPRTCGGRAKAKSRRRRGDVPTTL
jgi:hypothetical protein